jgi:hypothetical protein
VSHWICSTCGVQHADSPHPPERCEICEDARQYVGLEGQQWTTLDELRTDHRAEIREEEPGLTGIGCEPSFAIGQRALLVETEGNVLWDCITLLDDEIIAAVEARGGLAAIAISHPHYYSSLAEWSHTFGDVPVYIHADDGEWLRRRDANIELWQGERLTLGGGLTLVRCGGHFEGGTVLHWPAGAEGRGALLTGDIIQVIPDRKFVSFMYSYPNLIPLNEPAIRRIVASVEPFAFDRIHGAWWDRVVPHDAKEAVLRSAERYIQHIS